MTRASACSFLGFNIEGLTGIASKKAVRKPLDPNVNKGVLTRVPFMNVYKSAAGAQGYRTIALPYSDIARSMQDRHLRRRILDINGRGAGGPRRDHEILVPA